MHKPSSQLAAKPDTSYKTPLSTYAPGEYKPGKNGAGWAPVTDNVLVLPDTPMRRTAGGLIIPETASKEKPETFRTARHRTLLFERTERVEGFTSSNSHSLPTIPTGSEVVAPVAMK